MRFIRLQGVALVFAVALALGFMLPTVQQAAFCQETTAGLQGTVKDPSGAVVPGATVTVTTPTLVGSKVTTTDAAGYYRFANLPPGSYTMLVKAAGFDTLKRTDIVLEVGHLPTLNLDLKVGSLSTVVQVTSEAPLIDATTTTTLTNIPEETLQNIPHGTSFQSVIQFAPSARQEPLEGNRGMSNGTGGSSPGSMSNGNAFGFSIAGGSDSENSYLVEGQETANIIGGFSHTNVPMDFIQEMQMKTSGVDAEYGGALGGVVNVIMQKGTNRWHGSVFTSFQDGAMNGPQQAFLRYDPSSSGTATSWGAIDPTAQDYQPVRPHTSDFFPGFTLGGPIADLFPRIYGIPDSVYQRLKDHIFLFAAYNPEFNSFEETLDYGSAAAGGSGLGKVPFSQNYHTDYAYGRVDAEISQKVRVYASWLAQGQRENGESIPTPDSTQGYYNVVTGCSGSGSSLSCGSNYIDPATYSHTLGFTAPNMTLNTGADITLTNSLVSTTRFGYYFENYHDFGFPTGGDLYSWATNGASTLDTNGVALSVSAPSLAQGSGYISGPESGNFTHYNSNKATQFDEDIAWFHAGKGGTHNVKFGYQLHRNTNLISQGYNEPLTIVYPGVSGPYTWVDPNVGEVNCATVEAETGYKVNGVPQCVGTYGVININDYATAGTATGVNHGFFVQDAWTIGKGFTINAGLRVEREYLPAENQPITQKITQPINFGWGDKVAPRIGAAWDVFRNNKMKIFGGYGEYYDQMKLNVAISSYGGQNWEECWFALMQPSLSGVTPAFNSGGRYCIGTTTSPTVNWGSGTQPAGITFLEGQNNRANPTTCSTCSVTEEGTAPGLKPYAQHDSNFGVDYQIAPNVALEARWDRRRLDHVIEDSAIFNPGVGETFVIVNPGQGVNRTFNGFWNFLYGTPPDCVNNTCPTEQTVIPAARSYDGLEFRVTKQVSHNWMGMFSYTYSNFRGNYTGLTSSDLGDGGGGRNAPNNSRAFDEPYFSWNANGGSSSGLLPTDRPNALKGYAYYELPWLSKMATGFGIFQAAYSGTPLTTEQDVGYSYAGQPAFPTALVNRGKWIDATQDPTTGAITLSSPYTKRTPWYTDTDFNFKQTVKLGEAKSIAFDATFSNILNQHSVVAYWQNIDSDYTGSNFILANGTFIGQGLDFYSNALSGYNYSAAMNSGPGGGPITIDSQYGKPYEYQLARNIILGLHINF
ncbi:MAG TPA: carboxypeptidase regulatory-like domain-containing protein [Terracidiphilus sp.]|nr:carboxypeptidase regulatory-like domain-containing protein [Terracidiphilus sp.]